MTVLPTTDRAAAPPPRHHAEPAIEQRTLLQHDLQVVQFVMEGACSGTSTPQQCALLAHDLPSGARYRLIEQLCATLQQLTSEQEGADTPGLSGRDLLAAALERDASLAQAQATMRAQQKELAQLRADNLTMHAQLIEREAQLAWPSVSKASRCALAAKHLPQLQMAALQVSPPLATTAKSISPWARSSSSTGRLPSHRPSTTGQQQQQQQPQQKQKPQRRSYNTASQAGLRMWTPPATPGISGAEFHQRGAAAAGLGECEPAAWMPPPPFNLDHHRPGSRCESSRGDSRPISRGLYSR